MAAKKTSKTKKKATKTAGTRRSSSPRRPGTGSPPDVVAALRGIAASARSISAEATKLSSELERVLAAAPQPRAPMMMARGRTEEGRKRIENRWGRAFASKCSRALIERLTTPARETAAGAAGSGVVLEFAEQAAGKILPQRAASRTQRLASMRDAFYKLASPVCATLERTSPVPVQICWLNSTIRVAGPMSGMSEVAHHRDLQLLDVSRTMRREMNISGGTVRADSPRVTFGVSGSGVRVAVIDGEVNVGHPAFGGRATLQENLTSEPFGSPDAHGTAVAGIICAADATFSGIAPGALVMNYKVFTTGISLGDEFQGILAIEHALRDGADVANCSWGTGPAGDGSSREARAFNRAWQEGLVLVKSAGNTGPTADSMSSPADADGVIVVGATEREGTAVQPYSSRGPTTNGRHPHLVAPGATPAINMVTCLPALTGGFGDGGFGTSLAAPIVSGAAALLIERLPTATSDQIRERLLGMCRPLEGDVNASGAGLLDLSGFNPA